MNKATENAWQEISPQTNETWIPEEDKEIQGIYTGKKEKVGPNESNIYVLEVKGEKIGVWGSTLLDSRFAEIPMGNEVKIQYVGKKKSPKTGREYNDYLVMTRPRPFEKVEGSKVSDENAAAQMAAESDKE